jgi:hypothetical protein
MSQENTERRHSKLLEEITNLINEGQMSPELLLEKIAEYQTLQSEQNSAGVLSEADPMPGNNLSEKLAEILNNLLSHRYPSSNEAIDRQSLAVQVKQIGETKTVIKDEKIKHTNSGGLHSEVEHAIIISCEGKTIEANRAQGICEVTGKLAQRALSCRLCHRSICLRHCEFIEQDGAYYPYCNIPHPRSRTSCAKKTVLSINTWREIEKKINKGGHR